MNKTKMIDHHRMDNQTNHALREYKQKFEQRFDNNLDYLLSTPTRMEVYIRTHIIASGTVVSNARGDCYSLIVNKEQVELLRKAIFEQKLWDSVPGDGWEWLCGFMDSFYDDIKNGKVPLVLVKTLGTLVYIANDSVIPVCVMP